MDVSILSHDHESLGGIQAVQRQWVRALADLGHRVRWNGWRCDLLIIGHVHVLPLALVAWPGARVWLLIYGIEAWRPLTFWQRQGLRRVHRVIAISGYTRRRASPFLRCDATEVYPCSEC